MESLLRGCRGNSIALKLRHCAFLFCCLSATLLFNISSMAQSSPADCKTGCTSNDVQIQASYLSDINGNKLPSNFVCPASGQATVYLTLELTTNTPRIGVVI